MILEAILSTSLQLVLYLGGLLACMALYLHLLFQQLCYQATYCLAEHSSYFCEQKLQIKVSQLLPGAELITSSTKSEDLKGQNLYFLAKLRYQTRFGAWNAYSVWERVYEYNFFIPTHYQSHTRYLQGL